jgi:IS30 family transposase
LEEREEIFRLRYGERLGKDKSSVSRELKRGTKNRLYNPVTGEANRLNARRRQCPKLKMTGELWILIKPKLELRRSPEQVARWLEKEYPCYRMSAKTIYNYIHFHMKGETFRNGSQAPQSSTGIVPQTKHDTLRKRRADTHKSSPFRKKGSFSMTKRDILNEEPARRAPCYLPEWLPLFRR